MTNFQNSKKNFIRKIENFVCGNCGEKVIGDGYTDHCPVCLWGKHVDFEIPGDRESDCKNMMKPKEVQYIGGKYKILYRCTGCSHGFWVWAASAGATASRRPDSVEKLIELSVK